MAKFWISFRIKDDATYQDRYNSLIEAINSHATGAFFHFFPKAIKL